MAMYSWLCTNRPATFWYSSLWRMRSAVALSGACRWTSSSHDCLVSSMAAHSSPRGSTPASLNADGSILRSTLPRLSMPRASARRRAGSTVSTSVLLPRATADMAAAAAAVVVLPTPPDPQQTAISLAASRCSRVGACRVAVATSVPQLGAEGGGYLARRAQPVAPGEQLGDVQQGDARADRLTQLVEVDGAGTAHGHGQAGGVEDLLDGAPHRLGDAGGEGRLPQPLEHLLVAPAEQLGEDAVHDHG